MYEEESRNCLHSGGIYGGFGRSIEQGRDVGKTSGSPRPLSGKSTQTQIADNA
jgi:hypothetical protein